MVCKNACFVENWVVRMVLRVWQVEGLMIGLELSPDNKFAAAYTNNNQTILLNTLISEFFIIDNPLGRSIWGISPYVPIII